MTEGGQGGAGGAALVSGVTASPVELCTGTLIESAVFMQTISCKYGCITAMQWDHQCIGDYTNFELDLDNI